MFPSTPVSLLSLNLIKRLARAFPTQIVGIKESEGDFPLTQALLSSLPHFQTFVGNEKQIIQAAHLGAAGSTCGIANPYPELIYSLLTHGKKGAVSNPM
jgi:dihydrodipicolinate synthase/N-acetylneuraminate lyase